MSTHPIARHRAYTVPTPPTMDTFALEPLGVEPGRAVLELTPAGWHGNVLGTVHGGVLATLADNAVGAAVHTRLSAGTGYTTQGLNITFPRPVTVKGTAVHGGRRTAYATATIMDLDGRLLAHATTSCQICQICQIFQADGQQPAQPGQHAPQATGPTA
jgi:uncharacterized protein (TIGR00369 family)